MSTKTPAADITALVIKDAAHDRREAQARVEDIANELDALQVGVNAKFKPLADAVQAAEAEARAHARYKAHMPRKDWDQEQRRIQKLVDQATEKRDSFSAKARSDAAPIQKRLQEAAQRRDAIEQEWRVHERTARVAGIDVDALLEEGE